MCAQNHEEVSILTQKGIVKKTDGEYAGVSVMRSSACDACHAKGFCVECKKTMEARALNAVGAEAGDTVELESPTGTVLGYAAIMFLMPVVAALGSYLTASLWLSETASLLVSLAFFLAAFVFIYLFFNSKSIREKNTVTIVKIIKKDIDNNEEVGDIDRS